MPRNPGTGVYTQPAPDVVSGTTIESKVYNDFVNDVELDLNTARPIIAGGTGGDDAAEARGNLKTEVAMALVSDYGTQVWESGSFYSLTSATAPPVAGHAFSGSAQVQDANNIVVEARDESDTVFPGRVYVREKKAGTWVNGGAWSVDGGGPFVLKAGDTMTGNLGISKASPIFLLNKAAAGQGSDIYGSTNGSNRWLLRLGDDVAESGGNAGSNFGILRYTDTGVFIDAPLSISRSTGAINIKQTTLRWYLSGSGTYTAPAGCQRIRVRCVGGGGGGAGGGGSAGAGGTAGNTTFGGISAQGGNGTTPGTGTGGNLINQQGGFGGYSSIMVSSTGGNGGNSHWGGAGQGVGFFNSGQPGAPNTGGGGGGGGTDASSTLSGPGGGSGGYCESVLPAGTYSYAVGSGGAGGAAGSGGKPGAAGALGSIYIEEYYI